MLSLSRREAPGSARTPGLNIKAGGGGDGVWALGTSPLELAPPVRASWRTSLPKDLYRLQLPANVFCAQDLPGPGQRSDSALARSQGKLGTAPTF